ncbi:hypothetical protein Hokovirus_3_156 [Hokovirus HKV1]|uniref:Uncharacterized protein n=1 Tax=Hokovirus HKV1 TaxID=1977638 RepID=A0A1V0SGP9_9VIRU|nr:hypothetical protein Hokovirus_3_156 [Hokovirus HKV1]
MTIVSEIIKKDLTKIIIDINNDLRTYKLRNHSIKKKILYNNSLTFNNNDNILKDYKNNYDYDNILFRKDEKYMLIDFYNKKYNQFICIAFNKNKISNEYSLEYYNMLKKYYMIIFLFLITVFFLLLLNKSFFDMLFFDIIIFILVFLFLFLIISIITKIIINNKTLKTKRQKYYDIIGKNMDILANKINLYYKFSNKKNEIYSLKL